MLSRDSRHIADFFSLGNDHLFEIQVVLLSGHLSSLEGIGSNKIKQP